MQEPDQHPSLDKKYSGVMWIGFWIVLLALLGYLFGDMLDAMRNPNQQVQTRIDSSGVREVVLQRNKYGHYNFTGQINGQRVEFLLDTGATSISIPQTVADRIGLKKLYEVQFYTANGLAKGYATEVNEVRVGEIVMRDLQASINPNVSDEIILMGMNFLKQIEFTQTGDKLILRQYAP